MAEIDSSIYGQFKGADLIGSLSRGLEVRGQLDQRAAQKAEIEKNQKIQEAYKSAQNPDGSYDKKKLASNIGQWDGEKAMALNRQAKEDEIKDFDFQRKRTKRRIQILGSAKDDATWLQAKQIAADEGEDVSQLPDFFDPNLKSVLMGSEIETEKKLDMQWREQEAARAQANDDRNFGQKLAEFDRSGKQFEQTFGLQNRQFDYTKKQGDRTYGLQVDQFNYGKEKDNRSFGLQEQEIGIKAKEAEAKMQEKISPTGKLKNLAAAEKQRFDNITGALTALTGMSKAYDNGDNTFSLVGDNDFTRNRSVFVEMLGRMQSGGAITDDEVSNFKKLIPTIKDSADQQQAKLEQMRTLMTQRLATLGFKPDDMEALGFPKEQLFYANENSGPHGATVSQNGVTYSWNAATGQYE